MKFSFLTVFFICAGIVIGSFVSHLTKDVSFLSWLSYGMSFGLSQPLVLNLGVLTLTLGATFDLNISVILFVILAIVLSTVIPVGTSKKKK